VVGRFRCQAVARSNTHFSQAGSDYTGKGRRTPVPGPLQQGQGEMAHFSKSLLRKVLRDDASVEEPPDHPRWTGGRSVRSTHKWWPYSVIRIHTAVLFRARSAFLIGKLRQSFFPNKSALISWGPATREVPQRMVCKILASRQRVACNLPRGGSAACRWVELDRSRRETGAVDRKPMVPGNWPMVAGVEMQHSTTLEIPLAPR